MPAIVEPGTATDTRVPHDLLRAVHGQRSGWTRLERFAITMTQPTITAAATAIGVNRTTLIEQLHRLETDVGASLYHRATAAGQPQRPTRQGAALLHILSQARHPTPPRRPRSNPGPRRTPSISPRRCRERVRCRQAGSTRQA